MNLFKRIPSGVARAVALTRAGRLMEATALIQRTLRGSQDGKTSPDPDFIDTQYTRVAESDQPGSESGDFIAGSYVSEAGTRAYKLYIPTSYVGQPLPLLLMLHGCTQTADDFAKGTKMNARGEEYECFVLYPEQPRSANRLGCWNWFNPGDQRRDQGESAILAGMTREVIARYAIDESKVYVAGLSAGGAMAAVLAEAYPELYAAAGIHSGLPCGRAHDLTSALSAMHGKSATAAPAAVTIPTIVFHGDQDKTVHPRNADRASMREMAPMIEHGHSGGRAYTRARHHDANRRVVLEQWIIHGGKHAWFGGNPEGSYVDPSGPDASREMMRFFADRK